MDVLFNNIDIYVLNIFDYFKYFYNSSFFSVIKFIIGVYTVVLVVDIVLILIARGVSGDLKDTVYGMNLPKEFLKASKKNKLKQKWLSITKKLESDNEAQYKAAIVEADDLIGELIKKMGYSGETNEERLASIQPGQIDNLENLQKAHEVRKRIVADKDFKLDRDSAEDVLSIHEEFLRTFEVLD